MVNHQFASVILDEGLDKELDYLIPEHLSKSAEIGTRVLVPVRTSLRKGTILKLMEHSKHEEVKPIAEVLSQESLLANDCLELARWMSEYYATPLHKVIRLFFPPMIRKGMEAKKQLFVQLEISKPEAATLCQELRGRKEAQAKLLDVLLEFPKGILLTVLLEKASVNRNAYEQLLKKKIVSGTMLAIDRDPLANADFVRSKSKILNEEQRCTLDAIIQSIDSGTYAAHLLHGVTGSGKTEVYLQAIEHVLKKGQSAIYLVPEIALTSQTIERLKSRFSDKIVLFHHRLSDGERRDGWYALHEGSARIAVGPRSTLFSPVKNLGLIIIDEEHDNSYKQSEEMPCYHARDVAVMKAKLSSATVVLGSATPSLESYHNVHSKKYHLSTLNNRAENSSLPEVQIVDMRKKFKSHLFSDALLDAIEKRYKRGEQILLFLNRRGYHAQRLCNACGKVTQCPHCEVALTYHRKDSRLSCHLCSYELSPPPSTCAFCGSSEYLKYKGAGTEQVERALHAIFPELRTLRLDADTTKHKGSHEEIFKQFRAGKADLLIGTQMIAKGLHFPSCTLVGVLNADSSLGIPDFRSGERTFQIICQVSGRAGRGSLKGSVILQTWLPESPIIDHASRQDYLSFYYEEIASRELFGYPPFSRMVKILGSGLDEQLVKKSLEILRASLIKDLPATYSIEPIVSCGHPKIKDRFRFQFLIKGPSCLPVSRLLLGKNFSPKGVRILIDVDPISTFS
jgi:primosomal protein N' (replication factor Y)